MRILKSVVLVNVAILILSIFSFAVMAQTDSEEKNIFSNDMKIQGDALTCLSAPSCSECSAGSSAVITSPECIQTAGKGNAEQMKIVMDSKKIKLEDGSELAPGTEVLKDGTIKFGEVEYKGGVDENGNPILNGQKIVTKIDENGKKVINVDGVEFDNGVYSGEDVHSSDFIKNPAILTPKSDCCPPEEDSTSGNDLPPTPGDEGDGGSSTSGDKDTFGNENAEGGVIGDEVGDEERGDSGGGGGSGDAGEGGGGGGFGGGISGMFSGKMGKVLLIGGLAIGALILFSMMSGGGKDKAKMSKEGNKARVEINNGTEVVLQNDSGEVIGLKQWNRRGKESVSLVENDFSSLIVSPNTHVILPNRAEVAVPETSSETTIINGGSDNDDLSVANSAGITGNVIFTRGQYVRLKQQELEIQGEIIRINLLKSFDNLRVQGNDLIVFNGLSRIEFFDSETYYPRSIIKTPHNIYVINNENDFKHFFELRNYGNESNYLIDGDERISVGNDKVEHPLIKGLEIANIREGMWG